MSDDAEIEYADTFEQYSTPRYPSIDVPLSIDGTTVHCRAARASMGLVGNQFPDKQFRAVFAMVGQGDEGLYSAFTAEHCRAQAKAFAEMADDLDDRARVNPPQSFADMIREAGGETINLSDYIEPDPNEKNQVIWQLSRWAHSIGLTYDSLGHIPSFLHTDDPRPAKEQIDANYQHGGGWHEANEDGHWKIVDDKLQGGDPAVEPYKLVASCKVGPDEVRLFDSAWTAIVHPDGTMNVARLD